MRSRHKFVGSTMLDLFIYLNQEIYTQFQQHLKERKNQKKRNESYEETWLRVMCVRVRCREQQEVIFPFFLKLTIQRTLTRVQIFEPENLKELFLPKLVNTLGLKSQVYSQILYCYNCTYERAKSGHQGRHLQRYRFRSQSYV